MDDFEIMEKNAFRLKEYVCDNICKHCNACRTQDELDEHCNNCFFDKLKYCSFENDRVSKFIDYCRSH